MHFLPLAEFQYNKSKNRVLSLHLPPPSSFHRLQDPSSNASVASSVNSRNQSNNAYDFQRRADRVDEMDDDQRSKTAEMRLGGMIDFEKVFSVSRPTSRSPSPASSSLHILIADHSVKFVDFRCWRIAQSLLESQGERRASRKRRRIAVGQRDRDLHSVRSTLILTFIIEPHTDIQHSVYSREAFMQINADTLSFVPSHHPPSSVATSRKHC